ncbi:MAG: hypothetical protein AAF655_02865 [Bacteroidota bacterium]
MWKADVRLLKDHGLLSLIPQCRCLETNRNTVEWYFYPVQPTSEKKYNTPESSKGVIKPDISEEETCKLIAKAKPYVNKLPKKDKPDMTIPEMELRSLYARAYRIWTEREIEIMTRAYKKFGRIDKVAELLERQPSVVKEKLMGEGLL